MAKVITNFNIDLSDMAASGGNRPFFIEGDIGAIFSLEIKNEDDYYYDFSTSTFTAAKYRLKQKAIEEGGKYNNSITFPSITDDDQYDIYLFAESAHDTVHFDHNEVRFGDDSLDLNSSTGSNSNLLQKVIYQYTDTTITIYPWMQTLGGSAVSWIDAYVADTIVVGRGKNSGKQSFSMTVTTGATEAIQILRQPVENDFFKELDVRWEPSHASSQGALTGGGFVQIQGEDPWAEAISRNVDAVDGHTRGSSRLNMGGGCSEASKLIVDALPSNTQVGDRLTGWLHDSTGTANSLDGYNGGEQQVVTISAINPDGDNANEFSVDTSLTDQSGLTIADNLILYFNAPYYYRYQTKASLGGYGVLGLKIDSKEVPGMTETNPAVTIANGSNRPNTLGLYEDSISYTTEIINDNGSITEQTNKTINLSYPAIDITGFKPVITNGKVTKQDGILTFTTPQKIDTAVAGLEGNTWFLIHGLEYTKLIHNTEIKITNLKVELTKPTTTTTEATTAHATIAVADREGIIQNVSIVSGIGIASGVANPTITSAAADGAGDWVMSAVQTLESGATLTIENTGRTATITGDIEVLNCGDSNFNLILDVPAFITGA